MSQVHLLTKVLEKFCLASELKVNLEKSKFMASSNVSRSKSQKFASVASISPMNNLGKYLRFSQISGRVSKADF